VPAGTTGRLYPAGPASPAIHPARQVSQIPLDGHDQAAPTTMVLDQDDSLVGTIERH